MSRHNNQDQTPCNQYFSINEKITNDAGNFIHKKWTIFIIQIKVSLAPDHLNYTRIRNVLTIKNIRGHFSTDIWHLASKAVLCRSDIKTCQNQNEIVKEPKKEMVTTLLNGMWTFFKHKFDINKILKQKCEEANRSKYIENKILLA